MTESSSQNVTDNTMEHTGSEIFNLGTGRGTSVLELIETFSRVNQVIVPYNVSARREGDIPVCYANVDKAFHVMRWKAKRSLTDMCRDAWSWKKATAETSARRH